MSPKKPYRRLIDLPLAPLEALEGLGHWEASEAPEQTPAGSAEESSEVAPPIEDFHRDLKGEVELNVQAGSVVVLGPASDPMRCRALPGERELRAFRLPCETPAQKTF